MVQVWTVYGGDKPKKRGRRSNPEIREGSLEVMLTLRADPSGTTLKVDVIRKGLQMEGAPWATTRRFEIPGSLWGCKESSMSLQWQVLDGETARERNEA